MADTSSLECFDGAFTPQKLEGSNRAGLDTIADGDYDWTIVAAEFRITPKTGDRIASFEVRNEKTGQVVERAQFLSSQQNVDVFGGDLAMLGFDTRTWKAENGRPFSKELPKALAALPGRRFRGTKRAVTVNGTTYHNLYINMRLDDAKPGAAVTPPASDGKTDDAIPF